jgi:hypothetical protein
MMNRLALIFIMTLVIAGNCVAKDPEISKMDRAILENKLKTFSGDRNLPIGDLVLRIGMDFLNTPYVAKTLDLTREEKLVINLHQLDCTTFAENCLALALTLKSQQPGVPKFCEELEGIRYRGGKMDGYTSRLHYFSEWIRDNESRYHVKAVAEEMGGKELRLNLNFMSTHPKEYPQLINDPEATQRIKETEEKVSAGKFFYIPSEQFAGIENKVKDGDIVTLTTSIPGIDVSHVGILFTKDGKVYMLHASSTQQKVIVSTETFAQYITKSKRTTGIMIARPMYK